MIENPEKDRDPEKDQATGPGDADLLEPENALPEVSLSDLPENLRAAAARAGWTQLMPVQAKAIPYFLAGRDLMVQSRTGSGKTGAFILPILKYIDPARSTCQALVLVPTRELARQVAHEAEILGGNSGVNTVAVYGGVGYGGQVEGFRKGAHLVVGTPGRILDHLLKRALTLHNLKVLVFDEADRMLSMGFYPDMKQVQRYLPSHRINTHMFSATFPPRVKSLARQFMHEPESLSLSHEKIHVLETEHFFYSVPAMEKDRCLVRIIEIENPDSAIIFCNTKAQVHYLAIVLQRFGYDADELSADLPQPARDKVLSRVRAGTLRFLVATDVAARGLDIPELSHVIQYEPPEDPDAFIHRVGRTGRAGASGVAISLVSGAEELDLARIGKRFGIDLQERPLPTEADVEALVSERLTALLEARIRSRDKLHAERAMRFLPLVRSLMETEDESALIAMLLDDYYQESLHAPAPQAEEEPPPRRSGNPGAEKPRENRGEKRERRPSQRPSGEKGERGRPTRRIK